MAIHRRCRTRRDGFSMVEALTAVSVATIAGAALLTSLGAAVQSSTDVLHRTVAHGLAEQLMDEISAARFPTAANSPPTGTTRAGFDDIDDYDSWVTDAQAGLTDCDGRRLGREGQLWRDFEIPRLSQLEADQSLLEHFSREVDVERVLPDSDTGWIVTAQPADFRRVTVRVTYTAGRGGAVTLAEMSRIFSRVPIAP